jgi:hypothetical protein
MNPFFFFPASLFRFQVRTKAKAEDVNARLDEVSLGFDGVDASFKRAALAPVGETLADLPSLASRRNKTVVWDADGNFVGTVGATSAEMQAAITAAGTAQTKATEAAASAASVANSANYIQQLMLAQGVK